MWLGVIAVLVAATFWVVFVGAPYVPTRRQDSEQVVATARLRPGDHLVDLGSGDGRVLRAAAEQGIRGTGYELSVPFFVLSQWRLRRYRSLVRVHMANYWNRTLPDETTAVYTFLASKYMARLDTYLQGEADRLGRELTLVSYAFELPDRPIERRNGALLVYRFTPTQA